MPVRSALLATLAPALLLSARCGPASTVRSADVAALMEWAQHHHPQAFGYAAAQYQDQPDVLSGLLRNRALMLVIAGIGATLLADRAGSRWAGPSAGDRG
jgi:hypothetical protein